jgi:hypothetical protein
MKHKIFLIIYLLFFLGNACNEDGDDSSGQGATLLQEECIIKCEPCEHSQVDTPRCLGMCQEENETELQKIIEICKNENRIYAANEFPSACSKSQIGNETKGLERRIGFVEGGIFKAAATDQELSNKTLISLKAVVDGARLIPIANNVGLIGGAEAQQNNASIAGIKNDTPEDQAVEAHFDSSANSGRGEVRCLTAPDRTAQSNTFPQACSDAKFSPPPLGLLSRQGILEYNGLGQLVLTYAELRAPEGAIKIRVSETVGLIGGSPASQSDVAYGPVRSPTPEGYYVEGIYDPTNDTYGMDAGLVLCISNVKVLPKK